MEPQDPAAVSDELTLPDVIVLGDAAKLTRGSDSNSVEAKQNPYD